MKGVKPGQKKHSADRVEMALRGAIIHFDSGCMHKDYSKRSQASLAALHRL